MKNKACLAGMTLLIVGAVAPAFGHEMFLRAPTSLASPGTDVEIRLVNGTFDQSENSISRDRMRNVSVVVGGATTNPPSSAWRDDEVSSYLKFKAVASGTYVVGVSTLPKVLEQNADDFIEYLKHDGVPDTLAAFETQPNRPAKVRERYSKHVRSLVQVGARHTDDYSKPLGYPVEILLGKNPSVLKAGETLTFRVLFQGKPVADQFVRISHEGFHAHDASGNHVGEITLRTDRQGAASFTVNKAALWYVSLIHMQKVDRPDVDYESNWATVTFNVPQ